MTTGLGLDQPMSLPFPPPLVWEPRCNIQRRVSAIGKEKDGYSESVSRGGIKTSNHKYQISPFFRLGNEGRIRNTGKEAAEHLE